MSIGNVESHAEQRTLSVEKRPERGMEWGFMQWLCSGTLFADAQQTFGYVEINAGEKNPKHYHPNSDEVLFLIEGELDHSLSDAVFHLTAGMSIHIPEGVPHDAFNRGQSVARMVVAYPTPDRQVVMCEEGQE
jgi:quercetin dioxygenase-like cupin family protein